MSNDERVRQSRDGSLSVEGALASDGGYYLCQVGNGVGSDLSKVVHLTVHSEFHSLLPILCTNKTYACLATPTAGSRVTRVRVLF